MPKRIVYTKITPLPANVPRQLALDMLHSHGEIIELNPLVTGFKPINAPRDAERDEYFAQWYEIEEIITWGFGMKKRIAFKGCFHDTPWGLQTHIYAPMGVDLRNSYRIAGNQPGEPPEVRELGIDAPADGLYLKEHVEISCNIALAGFVKKETKQTLLTMIERMTKKAELLDDGVLHAMFENGRLKTINPTQAQHNDNLLRAPSAMDRTSSISSYSPTGSPLLQHDFAPSHTFTKYSSLPGRTAAQRSSQSSFSQGYAELDASPALNSYPIPEDAVEMDGSTGYAPDPNAPFVMPGTGSLAVSHAELADTSTSLHSPDRHSSRSSMFKDRPVTAPVPLDPNETTHRRYSTAYSPGSAVPAPLETRQPTRPRPVSGNYMITNPDRSPSAESPPYPDGPDAYVRADFRQAFKRHPRDQAAHPALADQMSGLGITGTPQVLEDKAAAQCPMEDCTFTGDAAAVSHHVNRQHFS